ncbi:MAG: hypothetical protein ACRDUY_08085 [Nitriliruptorales bacterium]
MRRVSRAEWGAKPPRHVTRLRRSRSLTVHYFGPHLHIPSHSHCANVVWGIQDFHMRPPPEGGRGWADIAYSFLACPHGYIFEGRGWGRRTAANGTNEGNSDGHAVMAMIGEGQEPPPEMWAAIRNLYAESGAEVMLPHSHWKPTDCPGDPLRQLIADAARSASDRGPDGSEDAMTPEQEAKLDELLTVARHNKAKIDHFELELDMLRRGVRGLVEDEAAPVVDGP